MLQDHSDDYFMKKALAEAQKAASETFQGSPKDLQGTSKQH